MKNLNAETHNNCFGSKQCNTNLHRAKTGKYECGNKLQTYPCQLWYITELRQKTVININQLRIPTMNAIFAIEDGYILKIALSLIMPAFDTCIWVLWMEAAKKMYSMSIFTLKHFILNIHRIKICFEIFMWHSVDKL